MTGATFLGAFYAYSFREPLWETADGPTFDEPNEHHGTVLAQLEEKLKTSFSLSNRAPSNFLLPLELMYTFRLALTEEMLQR